MKLQLALFAASAVGMTQAFCPSYCSGHGECTENDICDCFPGFGEADCSVRTCPSGLSWVVGTSSELSSLPTPNGPVGKHPYTECSSRGVCDRATGECECFEGYTGKACRRAACPNDCSGHGLCVADGDIRSVVDGANYYGGSEDFLLGPQKQYWNAKMSHQCICDQQFTGYDCSTKICPVGLDPTTSCDDSAAISDIQAVSVLFGAGAPVVTDADTDGILDHNEGYSAHSVEQFLTLTFTSQFNAQYETPAINYWDTAATVQQALISLPNFALGDVQVFKMFPRDEGVDSDSDGVANLNVGDSPSGGRCAAAYFEEYQSTLCTSNADCNAMFPSLGDNVLCDVDIRACVETEMACLYKDGDEEFTVDNCALNFEIDGLYRPDLDYESDGVAEYHWGHRLTAFERNCQAGKFDASDTKYALPCATDADCVACAGWTQVTNGVCDTGAGVCASLASVNGDIPNSISEIVNSGTGNTEGCSIATFIVKFTDFTTEGVVNDLECTISNTDATSAGASPMYRSSGLFDCAVTHIDVSSFTDGKIQDSASATEDPIDNELALCYDTDGTTLTTSMIDAASCTGAGLYNGAFDMTDINNRVAIDNGNVVSVEGGEYPVSPSFVVAGTDKVYTTEQVENKLTLSHDVVMPCSNKGSCDYTTGNCLCESGYSSANCGSVVTYV